MRNLPLLVCTLFLLVGCKENEEQLFELAYEVDVIFEAGLTQFEVHFQDSYAIDTRIDELLTASGRSREDISSIVAMSGDIVNIQTSASMDFIQDISIRLFDGSQFDPDEILNIQEVFFRDNIPQDRRTFIDLLPALPDVKEKLLEDRYNVSVRVQLRVPPPSTIEAKLRLKFIAQ